MNNSNIKPSRIKLKLKSILKDLTGSFDSLAKIIATGGKTDGFSHVIKLVLGLQIPMILFILFAPTDIQTMFAWLDFSLIIISILIYLLILLTNPRLLQSEQYRLDKDKLDYIMQKGEPVQLNSTGFIPSIAEKSEEETKS